MVDTGRWKRATATVESSIATIGPGSTRVSFDQ